MDFQENKKKKGFLTSRFASDPILVQGFAYNMVQYVMAGCQNERRRYLNKEKDKKRYDVCVDRYVTVGFENSGTMEKAHRKHPRLNYVQWRERN